MLRISFKGLLVREILNCHKPNKYSKYNNYEIYKLSLNCMSNCQENSKSNDKLKGKISFLILLKFKHN